MSSSYSQIFKSTAFTGGASVVQIVMNIVRTKAMAVLLGPSGIGLIGVYTAVVSLASAISGMGIGSSGVRQIAEANSSGDHRRIARTINAVRRIALALGVTGGVTLAALSYWISKLTFGNTQQLWAIAALGLAVVAASISAGQTALIQGLRRIGDLAKLNILAAIAGTVVSIPLIWIWREKAIVLSLLVVSFTATLFSWMFARRIEVQSVDVPVAQTVAEARILLNLGISFMLSSVMAAAAGYINRTIIVQKLGLNAAGHYSAAFNLAGIYAGFILQAMGADFYPRLTAVADHPEKTNRMVNEQTEIALLMAVPGVLATLAFAPWIIRVFYAGTFNPAIELLQWQVLGVFGRVISWPMGFIMLAKGEGRLFAITEVLANLLHVILAWTLVSTIGLTGAGLAFALLYLAHTIAVLVISRSLTGFRWDAFNSRTLAWSLPLVGATFAGLRWLDELPALAVGSVITLLVGIYCLRQLLGRIPSPKLERFGFLKRWALRTI